MIRYARYLLPGAPRSPIYLIHFVTSKCMGRCLHCFYWKEINRPENPMTPEEINRVASSMGPVLMLTLTGGEPYLRPDFDELVKAFYRARSPLTIGIATSGFHTDRVLKSAETLIRDCPRSNLLIGLPIEGLEEENDRVRGVPGFFRRTAQTILELNKLKRSLPPSASKRFSVLVDITVSSHNQNSAEETYRYIRDVLKPDNINVIIARGNTRDPAATDVDISVYERLNRQLENDIRARAWSGYMFLSGFFHSKDMLLRRLGAERYRGAGQYYPCAAGRLIGVMGPEGDVHGCELLDSPLGNLRENNYDFPSIWRSKEAEEFRKKIAAERCVCYHQCFLSASLIFNPLGFARISALWLKNMVSDKPDR